MNLYISYKKCLKVYFILYLLKFSSFEYIGNIFITFVADMKYKNYDKRRRLIGEQLHHERKCSHTSQKELASKLHINADIISKIEHGKRRFDVVELIEYAKALDYSLTEIAWKIESRLSGEGLLKFPKTNILDKKIRVDVYWHENIFLASIEHFVPVRVYTANNFADLQAVVMQGFQSIIDSMGKAGVDLPLWIKNKKYKFEYKFFDATSLLNAYSPFISLAAISRASGINQNLLSQYAKGIKKAGPNQLKRIMAAIHKIGNDLMAAVL